MSSRLLIPVILIALTTPCLAQPEIGVYFDEEGTRRTVQTDIGALGQAYVLVRNADMLLAGAAFRLDMTGTATLVDVQTAPGVVFGDLLAGLEIGLFQWVPQFGEDAVVLATFSYFATSRTQARWCVRAHPHYAEPVVANNAAIQYPCEGCLSVAEIRERPKIGIWFDADHTVDRLRYDAPYAGVVEAWITVSDAMALVTGAAFKLEFDAPLTLQSAGAQDGLMLGTLESGVEFGFYDPVPVFDQSAALLFHPVFLLVTDGADMDLRVLPHPNYATTIVADNTALLIEATGTAAHLRVGAVANEPMTWGRVKSLY